MDHSMQKNKTRVIALCVSRFFREEQKEHINTFCRFAEEYNCRVFVFSTLTDLYFDDINDFGEKQIYSVMDVKAFDVIVIMSETFKKSSVDREIADWAIECEIPVISINRRLEGCVNIDFTYRESFERIVRHIVEEHGCRKVNYIGGDRRSRFSRERFDVYRKVLEENHIPFEESRTGYGNFRAKQALEVLDNFLKAEDLPEAVICANDTMAVAVCAKLKALGIRVPEDIKVTGFDGMEFEKYNDPRLTTAVYNCEDTVRKVLETASAMAEGEPAEKLIEVPLVYQEGHSCGCENNHVLSALERLFDYQNVQDDTEEYYQEMMNMNSKANNCEDFRELMSVARDYSGAIRCREYWICLKEDIWKKIRRKDPFEEELEKNREANRSLRGYTGRVAVVSHSPAKKDEGIFFVDQKELLPDLQKKLGEKDQVMFLPIHLQGLFIGYMAVVFTPEEIRFPFLNTFMMSLRNTIESYWNRMAQEQLLCKDELTGLYNNRGFQKKIRGLFNSREKLPYFTMITLDMDNLKQINEHYSHEEGDNILRRLARIVEGAVDEGEICARLNGDEFVIITLSCGGRARAQEIQDYVERRLADYNLISGKPYELQVSIGYYTGTNVDSLDYEMISSQADKERYLSKQNHRREANWK